MRYLVTGDGLLIAGSEAGMVTVDEANVKEKGALGPGQLLAVDIAEELLEGFGLFIRVDEHEPAPDAHLDCLQVDVAGADAALPVLLVDHSRVRAVQAPAPAMVAADSDFVAAGSCSCNTDGDGVCFAARARKASLKASRPISNCV